MPTQTIYMTAGGEEYTWPITIQEVNALDISGDAVQIALGDANSPTEPWQNPDSDIQGDTTAYRIVRLLIGGTYTPPIIAGTYHVWWKIADSPETVIRMSDLQLKIV